MNEKGDVLKENNILKLNKVCGTRDVFFRHKMKTGGCLAGSVVTVQLLCPGFTDRRR